MTQKNNGGQAFPLPDQYSPDGQPIMHGSGGMTLRDYFAGQALAGMVAGSAGIEITPEQFAAQSYQLADAMLAEREKGNNQ